MAALGWRPEEFGLTRAFLLSAAIVAALIGGLVVLHARQVTPDLPPSMAVRLVEFPSATPTDPPASQPDPPPPEPIASVQESIPAPIPTITPDVGEPILAPPPTPTSLAMPEQPTPVAALPPSPRIIPHRSTAQTTRSSRAAVPFAATPPFPVQQPVPPPPSDISSGIGPYRTGLHLQIERNIAAAAIDPAGNMGTAIIEAVIEPDGHVLSARITSGSGSRSIDRAALAAVQRGGFRPFGPHMPPGPITITVPITILN